MGIFGYFLEKIKLWKFAVGRRALIDKQNHE
jgi:hypothetical protein